MRKFLSSLFAARKARLSVGQMDDRITPAMTVTPGVVSGFNPQPDPPASVRVAAAAPQANVATHLPVLTVTGGLLG
jgi:hypothetical protein